MKLRHGKRIDFTGTLPCGSGEFEKHQTFGDEVLKLIRTKDKAEVVIVVDRGYGIVDNEPRLVLDHLNLSGNNPLVGANHPIGERFPVLNGIYQSAADTMDQEETWSMGNPLSKLKVGIAAGVRAGQILDEEELGLVRGLGADFYCHNLVPAMIASAHAGLKVVGILLPEGASLDETLVSCLIK